MPSIDPQTSIPTYDEVNGWKPLRISAYEFWNLREYSHTLPTGQTPGKRWRRKARANTHRHRDPHSYKWIIGEYDPKGPYPVQNATELAINVNWYRPVIVARALSVKINGEAFPVACADDMLPYADVVRLAGLSGTPTVTWLMKWARDREASGILNVGEQVRAYDGLILNAHHTGNA